MMGLAYARISAFLFGAVTLIIGVAGLGPLPVAQVRGPCCFCPRRGLKFDCIIVVIFLVRGPCRGLGVKFIV